MGLNGIIDVRVDNMLPEVVSDTLHVALKKYGATNSILAAYPTVHPLLIFSINFSLIWGVNAFHLNCNYTKIQSRKCLVSDAM